MGGGVNHSPEGHLVGNHAMEPDVFIGGEGPGKVGADDTDDVAKHGEEDEATVVGEDQACTTGAPYGEAKAVEGGELGVRRLRKSEIVFDFYRDFERT